MGVCLRVLMESNKSRFDGYSVRNSVLIISHITFRDCRLHFFSDILSRNSCMLYCSFLFMFIDTGLNFVTATSKPFVLSKIKAHYFESESEFSR